MSSEPASPPPEDRADLLIAAYNHWGESFLRNEEMGDRRVTFYITLTTFVLGGLTLLAAEGGIGRHGSLLGSLVAVAVIAFGLLAIFLIGCSTTRRIIKRNLDTDNYVNSLDAIVKYLVSERVAAKALPIFNPYHGPKDLRHKKLRIWSLGTGGLLQTVVLINSLVVGAIPALSAVALVDWIEASVSDGRQEIYYIILFALVPVCGVLTWWGLMTYSKSTYRSEETKNQ